MKLSEKKNEEEIAGRGGWWKALTVALATATMGPVAGAIASGIIGWGNSRGWWRGGPSPWATDQLVIWENEHFGPHVNSFLITLKGDTRQILNSFYINKYNNFLTEMYAWKAYYEHVALRSTDYDEQELSGLKAATIGQIIDVVKDKWEEAASPAQNGLYYYEENFDPTSFVKISTDTLTWRGARVSAKKTYVADKPRGGVPTGGTGGGISIKNPKPPKGGNTPTGGNTGGTIKGNTGNTGGSTNPGGGTIKGNTGNTGGNTNPGGGTIKGNTGGGNQNTGGGPSYPPVVIPPRNPSPTPSPAPNPNPSPTQNPTGAPYNPGTSGENGEAKKNNNVLIVGAVLLGAILLTQSKKQK